MFDRLKAWARIVKRDVLALYLAGRDPRVPWYAKALAVATAAYALSPIDLIPDFIPVLGYLDDAIILPIAIVITVRLIPREVMAELRETADARLAFARRLCHGNRKGAPLRRRRTGSYLWRAVDDEGEVLDIFPRRGS